MKQSCIITFHNLQLSMDYPLYYFTHYPTCLLDTYLLRFVVRDESKIKAKWQVGQVAKFGILFHFNHLQLWIKLTKFHKILYSSPNAYSLWIYGHFMEVECSVEKYGRLRKSVLVDMALESKLRSLKISTYHRRVNPLVAIQMARGAHYHQREKRAAAKEDIIQQAVSDTKMELSQAFLLPSMRLGFLHLIWLSGTASPINQSLTELLIWPGNSSTKIKRLYSKIGSNGLGLQGSLSSSGRSHPRFRHYVAASHHGNG